MNMPIYDWGYKAEPEAALGGRRLVCPRGRVVGGSSSINGMIYVRGHAGDYDHWRDELGAVGWGYKDVLPYFKRMEHSHGGEAGWRGDSGPLHITRRAARQPAARRLCPSWGRGPATPKHRITTESAKRAWAPPR